MKKLNKTELRLLDQLVARAQEHSQFSGIVVGMNLRDEKVSVDEISATLAERGSRYGDFTDHAEIAQDLQDVMRNATTVVNGYRVNAWNRLSKVQKQALTVDADKTARILSGDPDYADNWHDKQGYAKLVEDRLPKEPSA